MKKTISREEFADLRGLGKKEGVVLEGGCYPNAHYALYQ